MATIFRQKSLEKLTSPERLDYLVQVTTPRGWLALTMVTVLLALVVGWSVLGRIYIEVQGKGILIPAEGVKTVVAPGNGQVQEITVEAGDIVRRGQIVARIERPVLLGKIKNARVALAGARKRLQRVRTYHEQDLALQMRIIGEEKANLKAALEAIQRRLDFLRSQEQKQAGLVDQGLITPAQLERTRSDVAQAQEQQGTFEIKLKNLEVRELELRDRSLQAVLEAEGRVSDLEDDLALQEEQFILESRVTSRFSARVVELKVSVGAAVRDGEPLMALEPIDAGMKAVLYLEAGAGKKVRPGMEVTLVPSTVKQEEYGSMLGLVTYVDPFPSSREGMFAVLRNASVIESLTKDELPIAVYVDIIPDTHNKSGVAWTSGRGPDISIETGTLCRGAVATGIRRPISLIIPMAREDSR